MNGAQQCTNPPDVKETCALKRKQLKFTFKNEDGEYQVSTFKKWTHVIFKILKLEPLTSNNTVSIQQ